MKKNKKQIQQIVESIKKQGRFDYGLDELESIGVEEIFLEYDIEMRELTPEQREELWKELRIMAEENDYIRDYEEEINQEG